MAYINESIVYNDDGKRIGKRILITGNPPWKMFVYKVMSDGTRLQFWRANNDEDLIEWINSLIDDRELNDDTLSFIITEDGKDRETVKEYCDKMNIVY